MEDNKPQPISVLDEINTDNANSIAKEKEKILLDCLKRFTGKEIPLLELKGRLSCETYINEKDEIFKFDGKPFVVFYPIRYSHRQDDQAFVITSSLDYRYLG